MATTPLPFPFNGLNEVASFGEQPPLSTRDAQNVRVQDPDTGRLRGAQRSGLSKYNSLEINGTNPIKALASVVVDDKQLDYAELANGSGTIEWTNTITTDAPAGIIAIETSSVGDVFLLANRQNAVYVYSSTGNELFKIPLPFDSSGSTWPNEGRQVKVMALDEDDNLYVGVSANPGAAGTDTIAKLIRVDEDRYYTVWTMGYDMTDGNPGCVKSMVAKNGNLYVLVQEGVGGYASATEVRLLVYGDLGEATAPTAPLIDVEVVPDGTNSFVAGGVAVADDESIYVTWSDIVTPNHYLRKYSATGSSVWTADSVSDSHGGMGNAVAAKDGYVWTTGPGYNAGAGSDKVYVVGFTDDGNNYTKVWSKPDASTDWEYASYTKIRVDAFSNIHIGAWRDAHASNLAEYIVLKGAGSGGGPSTEFSEDFAYPTTATASNAPGLLVALPPSNPDYSGSAAEPTRPEFAYVTHRDDVGATIYLEKLRMVSVTTAAGSARTFTALAVVNDTIRTFTDTGAAGTPGTGTTAPTLDTTFGYVDTAVLYGECFFTDGTQYKVYNAVDDETNLYEASGSGEIPPRCKLMAAWNGRILISRNADDAHNIFASAQDDPYDWDFFPYTETIKSAWALNAAEVAGRMPDIVNALIPYSDDILIIGGDSSIFRATGDPRAGGGLDLISDTTGIAFGSAWAKDPEGYLYFFGSKGGVYRMNPYGEAPESLTRLRIERRLQSINLTTYRVELVWNFYDDGLHVFVIPYGAGGTVLQHWFWERKADAWHEDTFGVTGDTGRQPHSLMTFDGDDPDDRVLLLGCEDGFVRKWDKAADDDDGLNIDSHVLMGPLIPASEAQRELKLRALTAVLAQDQGPCNYMVYVNDRPDVLPASPQRTGPLSAGRNPTIRLRERGSAAWVRLRDASATRWALESLELDYAAGSRPRVRT